MWPTYVLLGDIDTLTTTSFTEVLHTYVIAQLSLEILVERELSACESCIGTGCSDLLSNKNYGK